MRKFFEGALQKSSFETVPVATALGVLFVYCGQLKVMQTALKMDQRAWITVKFSELAVKVDNPITTTVSRLWKGRLRGCAGG
jgi:hypothetical protein